MISSNLRSYAAASGDVPLEVVARIDGVQSLNGPHEGAVLGNDLIGWRLVQ
jgi:hypothetical protein